MLFIAHLCNHHTSYKVVGDLLVTVLYTVRNVGSGSRDVDAWAQTSLYTEDWGLCLDPMTWSIPRCGFAGPGLILR